MEFSKLDKVIFLPASNDEIRHHISKVMITNPINNVTFDKNGSLFDIRMGAFRNIKCGTCHMSDKDCTGHFGHISLAKPVVNPSFLKNGLKKILSLYCFSCFLKDCVCNKEYNRENKIKRRKMSRGFKIRITTTPTNINRGGRKTIFMCEEEEVSLDELYALIKKIPREVFLKDFPHIKHMKCLTEYVFIHDLLVLPISSRPPNYNNGEWRPCHLSRLYMDIIKKSIQLKMKEKFVHSTLLNEYHNELQNSIEILFDINNTRKILNTNVLNNGGIRQRIDGKSGFIRKNLMGKRCEFSARTVLSGDTKLGINEIGIPASFAENLTIPVVVSVYNIDEIHKMNIKYVTKKSGQKYDMNVIKNIKIEIGDIVDRKLINGDIVAINRQPTLHRGSMMACYVRIFPHNTLRLNYGTMLTLNADTDGDEINIHVPQDIESRTELEELMLASTQIVSSQSSVPLIGCTLDSLTGCYKLSKSFLSENDFMDILFKLDLDDELNHPDILKPRQYSGLRVFEKILEFVGINIPSYKNGPFIMKNNKILKGIVDKNIVGKKENSLVHHVYLTCGHEKAAKFIHLCQLAATEFLDKDGFSMSIQDCIIYGMKPINTEKLEEKLSHDFFENAGKWDDVDEDNLCDALGELTKLTIPDHINDNRLVEMIESGAKGSVMNFNQITRIVGQQIGADGRIQKAFNNGGRTLPHYSKFENSAESRGLVKNSFIKGLKPQEFFFHAQASRVGLIDTACKTAVTGHTFRKLVKNLEPLIVKDSGNGKRSVYNSITKTIIQPQYGADNTDATYMKRLNDDKGNKEYI